MSHDSRGVAADNVTVRESDDCTRGAQLASNDHMKSTNFCSAKVNNERLEYHTGNEPDFIYFFSSFFFGPIRRRNNY